MVSDLSEPETCNSSDEYRCKLIRRLHCRNIDCRKSMVTSLEMINSTEDHYRTSLSKLYTKGKEVHYARKIQHLKKSPHGHTSENIHTLHSRDSHQRPRVNILTHQPLPPGARSLLSKGPQFALQRRVTWATKGEVECGLERLAYGLQWSKNIRQKRVDGQQDSTDSNGTVAPTCLPRLSFGDVDSK